MEIIKTLQVAEKDNPHKVSVRMLHETEHVQVVYITLLPGEALKTHVTPVDASFYILEGQGIVEIGQERAPVVAGDLLPSAKGIPHRLVNDGEQAFAFLVIKTPARAGKAL